ncbi:MAG: hypothetical protein M3P06_02100 [Acidobacteriota bacterium]|nr:hypothetical protein [Acidobacteriota bacterium]
MADIHRYAADLARDLGAPDRDDPVASIIAHAEGIIEPIRRQGACSTLTTLVGWVASKLGIKFEIVESDEQLATLQREYAARGETGFVGLALGLQAPDCYGGTVALDHPRYGIKYVAVIDCRGEKRYRSYFTKCHEVSHFLLKTKQQLLVFRRTHESTNHPEEQLVDRVASRLGFYPPLLRPYFVAPLSFDLVGTIISELCPEASWESAVRGIVAAWPYPAVWLRGRLGLKRAEKSETDQGGPGFLPSSAAKLRISDAPAISQAAAKFGFFRNMRVPPNSVITSVFDGAPPGEAREDLSWWDVSGQHLHRLPIRVHARRVAAGIVEAVLVADQHD